MSESCEAVRILILNGDLPIFPGRAGHEYLHTTLRAQRAHKVGLVSMGHTPEQHEKKQDLARAGVELYLAVVHDKQQQGNPLRIVIDLRWVGLAA
jgi:hypothetical protein